MKTTNRNCKSFVEKLKPFKASNLEGRVEGNKYVVYSYGWYPILAHSDGKWFENAEGYSVSTKRQISQARPWNETIKVSHATLKDLIQG